MSMLEFDIRYMPEYGTNRVSAQTVQPKFPDCSADVNSVVIISPSRLRRGKASVRSLSRAD